MMIHKLDNARKRKREEETEGIDTSEEIKTTRERIKRMKESNAKRRRMASKEKAKIPGMEMEIDTKEDNMQMDERRSINREQAAAYSSNCGKDGPQKPQPYPSRVVPGMKQSLGGEVNRPNPHYYTTLHYTTLHYTTLHTTNNESTMHIPTVGVIVHFGTQFVLFPSHNMLVNNIF